MRATSGIFSYAAAIAIVSGANFVSVPILIQLLGAEEFGRWALVEPIILSAVPLALLGIHFGAIKLISKDGLKSGHVASALLPFIFPILLFVALIAYIVTIAMGQSDLAIWTAGIVCFEAIILFSVSVWRAEGKAQLYAMVEGGRALGILSVLALLLFYIGKIDGVEQYFWVRMTAAILTSIFAMVVIKPKLRPSLDQCKDALSYGAPFVVGSVLAVGLINFDRYFIASIEGNESLAMYIAHMKISFVVGVAVQAPFATWFMPEAIRRTTTSNQGREFFRNVWLAYLTVLIWVAGNLWVLIGYVWAMIFPEIEFDSTLFAILLISSCVFAIWTILAAGVFQPGQTKWMVPIIGMSLITLLIVGYPLTQCLGANGAALARLAGVIVQAGLFAWASYKILNLSWPVVLPIGICLAVCIALLLRAKITVGNVYYDIFLELLVFNLIFGLGILLLFVAMRRRIKF